MVPRILYLHPKTYKHLIRLRKQAERDGAYRVAKRLQAVVLNSEGCTSGELAHLLAAPRSRVSEWLARYQAFGVDGLLEGHRSGRPLELTLAQRKQLDDILDSGPVAWIPVSGPFPWSPGSSSESSAFIIIRAMCAGCSIVWASRSNARVACWPEPTLTSKIAGRATPIPALKKAQRQNRALIFTDEASFRQASTLHTTWSRFGRHLGQRSGLRRH